MDPTDPTPDPAPPPAPASPEVPDTRLFLEITPKNILSFGPDTAPIELGNLNVLIGSNGSGKSNLIDVLSIFTWIGTNLSRAFPDGIDRWLYRDAEDHAFRVDVVMSDRERSWKVFHTLEFDVESKSQFIRQEQIGFAATNRLESEDSYDYLSGRAPVLRKGDGERVTLDANDRDEFDPSNSILSQRQDPRNYFVITHLARRYKEIRIYRDYTFGRRAAIHHPQRADQFQDRLEWDASNLGLVVSRLLRDPKTKRRMIEALSDLYDGLDSVGIDVRTSSVEIYFTEGDRAIPATRLSDGSLRYLWLLAILLDPDPPPFIAIEEPELGLHPDLIPKIADLLVDASTRTQLLVTTHSDILIDALSEHPEYVLTCEKHDGQTEIKRLDPDELAPWLKRYRLGQLWTRGHLGGVRW